MADVGLLAKAKEYADKLLGDAKKYADGKFTSLKAYFDNLLSDVADYDKNNDSKAMTLKRSAVRNAFGACTTLWSGEWSGGNITVPNTANYTLFKISMKGQGTCILAMKNGNFIRGMGGYSTATPTVTYYNFAATFSDDTWTLVACNSFRPTDADGVRNDSEVVTTIVGII